MKEEPSYSYLYSCLSFCLFDFFFSPFPVDSSRWLKRGGFCSANAARVSELLISVIVTGIIIANWEKPPQVIDKSTFCKTGILRKATWHISQLELGCEDVRVMCKKFMLFVSPLSVVKYDSMLVLFKYSYPTLQTCLCKSMLKLTTTRGAWIYNKRSSPSNVTLNLGTE